MQRIKGITEGDGKSTELKHTNSRHGMFLLKSAGGTINSARHGVLKSKAEFSVNFRGSNSPSPLAITRADTELMQSKVWILLRDDSLCQRLAGARHFQEGFDVVDFQVFLAKSQKDLFVDPLLA